MFESHYLPRLDLLNSARMDSCVGTGSKKALNPVYNTGSRGSECMPGRFNIITEEVVCGRLKRQAAARRALLPRV